MLGTSILLALPGLFQPAFGQKLDGDELNFELVDGWADQRKCVTDCFQYCYGACSVVYTPLGDEIGCKTNKCLCSEATTLKVANEYVLKCAKTACETVEGSNAAQKLLADYCTLKGYDVVSNPSTSQTEDGTRTVTVTVTATPGMAARASWGSSWNKLALAVCLPVALSWAM